MHDVLKNPIFPSIAVHVLLIIMVHFLYLARFRAIQVYCNKDENAGRDEFAYEVICLLLVFSLPHKITVLLLICMYT